MRTCVCGGRGFGGSGGQRRVDGWIDGELKKAEKKEKRVVLASHLALGSSAMTG